MTRARRGRCLAGAVALMLGAAGPAVAAPEGVDCSSLQPLDGPLGYGVRAGSPRCEGFFQSPVGAAAIELVYLRYAPLQFDTDRDRALVVRAPAILPPGVAALTVSALALSPQTYYRMDATLEPGGSLRWPVDAVLAPAGFTGPDLGVFGALSMPEGLIHVPLWVATEEARRPQADARVEIGLRAATELEEVMWRAKDPEGSAMEWAVLSDGPLFAGDVVPLSLTGDRPMAVDVEIAAMQRATGRWIRRELTVWHALP